MSIRGIGNVSVSMVAALFALSACTANLVWSQCYVSATNNCQVQVGPCGNNLCNQDADGNIFCPAPSGQTLYQDTWNTTADGGDTGQTGQTTAENIACYTILNCVSGIGNCVLVGDVQVCQAGTTQTFGGMQTEQYPSGAIASRA